MDSVKKVSSKKVQHHPSSARHKVLQKSTTLNRKFVKPPAVKAKITKRQQMEREAYLRRKVLAERMDQESRGLISHKVRGGVKLMPIVKGVVDKVAVKKVAKKAVESEPKLNPTAAVAKARAAARKAPAPRQLTAQEMKERAIKQALARMATIDKDDVGMSGEQKMERMTKRRVVWRKRKLFVALAMSVVSIALLGYLVYLNLPDLSVRVAAMQIGIDSAYPSYIPRGYKMKGLVAEDGGKITIDFVHKDAKSFTLTQEKSSWDSKALLSQFVIPQWGKDYEVIKEQGLTIYVVGSDAAWVNGGVFYQINDAADDLTKQQLHDIAVSL